MHPSPCARCLLLLSLLAGGLPTLSSQSLYPDQLMVTAGGDSLLAQAESAGNLEVLPDGSGLRLVEGATSGVLILKPRSVPQPFDEGLPSWNGTAPGDSGGFRVLMRFPYLTGWSPWLDVGYWKANLWTAAKKSTFAGGRIDIDTALLDYYTTQWQFAVEFKRREARVTSPALFRLSLCLSDSRTTAAVDHAALLADRPPAIFIKTTFLAQYRIDTAIGGRICSPTTVAMILLSFGLTVDPLQFAWDTYDPYYDIFGVWPRVVQNGSEYGLVGTVTRLRSWSAAWEVLDRGGRVAMSIGEPLYSGHLVMLAGFTAAGDPIVHDPARTSTGYGYIFNKGDLGRSWFDKGGVAYTFFPRSPASAVARPLAGQSQPASFVLQQNYPNPFNSGTAFEYTLQRGGRVDFSVFDVTGRKVATLAAENQTAGWHRLWWKGCDDAGAALPSGSYLYLLRLDRQEVKAGRMVMIR